jgi:glutathione synthase/RimK-type ligase-like ATP-grasp enzyme
VIFYAEALLAHAESLGIPVINPVTAYRFEKSKALQLGLFERLGVRYPRALVVNHRDQVLKALDRVRFPLVVKPNVGGSGAGIVRFTTREDLVQRLDTLDFGPDGTALVQEYIESAEDAIVRVEVLDGQYLYAIRIVRQADAGFNLCPADICQVPPAASASTAPSAAPSNLGACPVDAKPGLSVTRVDAPQEAIDTVIRLTRAASIDVGGVEYLVSRADGNIYYYDVNATSNFVANAPEVVGFDPTARFVDYIVRAAQGGTRQLAA